MPEATFASLQAYRSAAKAVLPRDRLPAAALGGVLTYIGRADRAIAAADVPAAHEALMAAQQVLAILRGSLDRGIDPEMTGNLDALYGYVMAELGRANIAKDAAILADLIPVVATLREAWEGAATAEVRQRA